MYGQVRTNTVKIVHVKFFVTSSDKCFKCYTLGSHTDIVVGNFFEANSLDILTVSRNGQLCVWECSVDESQLNADEKTPKRKKVRFFALIDINRYLESKDINFMYNY